MKIEMVGKYELSNLNKNLKLPEIPDVYVDYQYQNEC